MLLFTSFFFVHYINLPMISIYRVTLC